MRLVIRSRPQGRRGLGRAAALVGTVAVLAVTVGCQSDGPGAGTSRSATPSKADASSMDGARVQLVTAAKVQGSPTGVAERAGDDARYVVTREGRVLRTERGKADLLLDLGP